MAHEPLYPGFQNPLLGAPRRDLPKHVAIVGAGTIGPDIGYYFKQAVPGLTLTVIDVRQEALDGVVPRFQGYAQKAVARGKMKEEQAATVADGVVTSTDYAALASADLVIEAATENIELKKKIFSMIEEQVSDQTVICSNTSSIPASWLFSHLAHPERTTIAHFFGPAWRNPAVEVIAWEKGSRETVDYLRWLFAATGKVPLVTADVVLFMLDRIFVNWCNEAVHLFSSAGATSKQIDAVAEEFVAAGPFFVQNLTNGNLINYECGERQMPESPAYAPPNVILSVDRWLVNRPGTPVEVPEEMRQAVRDRLLGILFSQALDIVARGIGTPEDLHQGSLLALGFKQTPSNLLRDLGKDEVARILERLVAERPGLPGPDRMDAYETASDFNRFLLVDRMDGVVVITIRRPAQLNALTEEMTAEILGVVQQYEERSGRPGVRHHRLRSQGLLRRRRRGTFRRHARGRRGVGAVRPGLLRPAGAPGRHDQAGGGRRQWSGAWAAASSSPCAATTAWLPPRRSSSCPRSPWASSPASAAWSCPTASGRSTPRRSRT